jgi:homocysteine S-methyltransferase
MLDSIIKSFAYAIKDLSNSSLDTSFKPWLALYPNGGVAYDPVAKQWQGVNHTLGQEDKWAISFSKFLENHELEYYFGMFGGLMVGGCCKTKPSDIKALKRALLNSGILVKNA